MPKVRKNTDVCSLDSNLCIISWGKIDHISKMWSIKQIWTFTLGKSDTQNFGSNIFSGGKEKIG